MNKEELKNLLDSMTMAEIEEFEIKYKKEKSYGMYNENNTTQTLTYNR